MNTPDASHPPAGTSPDGAFTFVCSGELLLRLTAPRGEVLLQSPRLETCFGGAEANVAVALARFGQRSALLSAVPDHALGAAAIAAFAQHGVDTRHVARRPGRLGTYYLEAAAGLRAPRVIYDRADSCFACCRPGDLDAAGALRGAHWLHQSGITAALGESAAALALESQRIALAQGARLSFDTNVRPSLWGERLGAAPAILRRHAEVAEVLFADARILNLMLGAPPDPDTDAAASLQRAAARAFAAWPALQVVAATERREHDAEHHELRGLLATRDGLARTAFRNLPGIVERIGSGDAFAAGVLYGHAHGEAPQSLLEFATAAACLKHYIAGDACLASLEDVRALTTGAGFGVRR